MPGTIVALVGTEKLATEEEVEIHAGAPAVLEPRFGLLISPFTCDTDRDCDGASRACN